MSLTPPEAEHIKQAVKDILRYIPVGDVVVLRRNLETDYDESTSPIPSIPPEFLKISVILLKLYHEATTDYLRDWMDKEIGRSLG